MSVAEQTGRILLVDFDEAFVRPLAPFLKEQFAAVHVDADIAHLPDLLTHERYDVILINSLFLQPKGNGDRGIGWIKRILEMDPLVAVLVRCQPNETALGMEAVRAGATDFLIGPTQREKIVATLSASYRLRQSREEAAILREQHHHVALLSVSLKLDEIEQQAINLALQKHKGNISHSAKELGLTRTSLYRRIQKYGIQPSR